MTERLELIDGIDDHPLIMLSPSVNTITFYVGLPPVDYLTNRVSELLALNPWLAGRMESRNGSKGTDVVFSKSDHNIEDYFMMINDPSLHPAVPYSDLYKRLLHFHVKSGNDCINKPEPLFQVVLIVSDPTHFGVLFSFSHVLGDGFTHYELYGMLSTDSQVRSLQAKRSQDLTALKTQMTGGQDIATYMSSPSMLVNAVCTLLFVPKATVRLHTVNQGWVSEQKAAYLEDTSVPNAVRQEAPFLSTNDVLTSWWFNFTNIDFGLMAMNLRKRIPELTFEMAGNYEYLPAYQRVDFGHPAHIRQSLSRARGHYAPSLPGPFSILSARLSILSSWATFYRDVELTGCTQLLHLPCADDQNIATSNLAVLFRPRKGELALMSFTRGISDEEFSCSGALGEAIMGATAGANTGSGREGTGVLTKVVVLSALVGVGAVLYSYCGGKLDNFNPWSIRNV